MSNQTEAERELAELLVESLNLDGITPSEIDPEAPLFNTGLGLDSIDALELALAVSKAYGVRGWWLRRAKLKRWLKASEAAS